MNRVYLKEREVTHSTTYSGESVVLFYVEEMERSIAWSHYFALFSFLRIFVSRIRSATTGRPHDVQNTGRSPLDCEINKACREILQLSWSVAAR